MTRREFISAAALSAVGAGPPARLSVPVVRIIDTRAQFAPAKLRRFHSTLWPECLRDFGRGGIDLQVTEAPGEVRHSPADRPIFVGLRHGAINLVVTNDLPLYWDNARALPGVTTIYDGYHICLIALRYAHGNQAAFFSVNTCTHELLHALMQDVFLKSPKMYQSGSREFRVDWYATRLWIFHDGGAVRQSAAEYLRRLR